MKRPTITFISLSVQFALLAIFAVSTVAAQEKIFFESNRDGDFEIFSMGPNGEGQTQLTQNTAADTVPSVSGDGRKVVFSSARDGNNEIYVMDADGSNQTRLTNEPAVDLWPDISADGTKIVFVSLRSGTGQIYMMNVDGTGLTRLTNTSSREVHPHFARSMDKIVFVSNRDGNDEIYIMNADGSGQTRLTNNPATDFNPKLSPDGSKIAFNSLRHGDWEIYLINPDGTGETRLTADPGLDAFPSFSPDGSKIAFMRAPVGEDIEIYVMSAAGGGRVALTVNSAIDASPSWTPGARRPVLIVPGIAGTYAADVTNDDLWLMNRGVQPSALQIDPLIKAYHDLIKTFENIGYVRNTNLFVVNYDWRLTPGPIDNSIDGVVSDISAQSISDSTFHYGVDYLGHALKQAAEKWKQDHPGGTLSEVDIVAHSTGGLVARTYIQSPAYNEIYNGSDKLPKVKNLIMVGVPNRGASKAWNPLHDNWASDPAYRGVLSKIVNRAYQKVLAGGTILGHPAPITLNSIKDPEGDPDPVKFIDLYVPTIRSLLATYTFIDFGAGYTHVNGNPADRNEWVLDLNHGLDLFPTADPSPFANKCNATVIYAATLPTATGVVQRSDLVEDVIAPFTDFLLNDSQPPKPWFQDIFTPNGGDGTVPTESSSGQFIGDSRVTLRQISAGANISHTGLMSNVDAQKTILQTVGASFQESSISTGLGGNQVGVIASIILDPVDGFLVDGAGRRLGYSEATGGLAEIPGSIWFGNENGIGWIFGSVQGPLHLELTGRGEPYYVMVSLTTAEADGGVVDSGFLGTGVQRSLPITIGTPIPFQCPHGQGYWKNNPAQWPLDQIILGSQTYTKNELLGILDSPVAGGGADASLILARQLIAAKLNLANHSDPAVINAAISNADALLATHPGRLPFGVRPSTAAGRSMTEATTLLENYNNGALTPTCSP